MSRQLPVLYLFVGLLTLASCSNVTRTFSNDHAQVVAAPDKVSAILADAADRASKSLETLAAVEAAKSNTTPLTPISNVPSHLRRAVTINWVGPAEQIAKTLADRAGYGFLTIGSPPPVPIVVSIDVENMPIIDVMRNLGLQLGMRANLKLDSNRRMLEIHYVPNTGVGG